MPTMKKLYKLHCKKNNNYFTCISIMDFVQYILNVLYHVSHYRKSNTGHALKQEKEGKFKKCLYILLKKIKSNKKKNIFLYTV